MTDNATDTHGEPETAPAAARQTRADVNREIRGIAATAGLGRDWADGQIDADADAETARRAAFEAMTARRADPIGTRATISTDHIDPAAIVARAGEALFARAHPDHELSPAARGYAHMTVADLARECLRQAGQPVTGLSGAEIVTRGLHTTSDFPLILGDAAGRELRRGYAAAPRAAMRLARQSTRRDFRPQSAIVLGAGPTLEQVHEGGEFTRGAVAEAAETYSIATFGRIIGISRQALVNDDLGAFAVLPARMGAAARAFEAAQVAGLIAANPNLADGRAVFHATRGNIRPATGQTVDAVIADLAAARLAMRRTTGLAGEVLGLRPAYVLAAPELETTMERALSAVQATRAGDTNPFSALKLVIDPRLTGTAWYLAADPQTIDGLEYSHLSGAPGPQIETRQGFEVDGLEIRVRLDFGCGWIDWRGWQRVG